MKKILILAIVVMIGLVAFTSCSKSSSSPSYSMTATLGTSAYSAPNCLAVTLGTNTVIEGLGGSATTPTFPYVALNLASWNGAAGTVNFDSTMTTSYGQYLTSSTSFKVSKTGSVVISNVTSTSITGTFSFTCTDGTVVSSGSFTAKKM